MNRCIYVCVVLMLASSCTNDHEAPQPEPIEVSQSFSVTYMLPDSTCTSIGTFGGGERGVLPSGYYALCNGGNMGCYAYSSIPSTPSTGPSYYYRHISSGPPQRTFTLRRPDGTEVVNVVNPTVADIHMLNIPTSVSRSTGINVRFSAGPLNSGERYTCYIFQDAGHWAVTDSLVGDSMFVFTPTDLMDLMNGNAQLSVSHVGRSLPLDQNDGATNGTKLYSSRYEVQVTISN